MISASDFKSRLGGQTYIITRLNEPRIGENEESKQLQQCSKPGQKSEERTTARAHLSITHTSHTDSDRAVGRSPRRRGNQAADAPAALACQLQAGRDRVGHHVSAHRNMPARIEVRAHVVRHNDGSACPGRKAPMFIPTLFLTLAVFLANFERPVLGWLAGWLVCVEADFVSKRSFERL